MTQKTCRRSPSSRNFFPIRAAVAPPIPTSTSSKNKVGVAPTCAVISKIARLIRDNIIVRDNISIDSLKHFKDDVREVKSGLECGIKLAHFDDVKIDDFLDFFIIEKVARTL